jgi:hypothetical protein
MDESKREIVGMLEKSFWVRFRYYIYITRSERTQKVVFELFCSYKMGLSLVSFVSYVLVNKRNITQ